MVVMDLIKTKSENDGFATWKCSKNDKKSDLTEDFGIIEGMETMKQLGKAKGEMTPW